MSPLFNIWYSIQHTLFPWLENELGPLTEKQQEFIRVVELAEVQKHMSPYRWQGLGRKRDDRLAILKAFVAKAVYNFPTTKVLIAYLHDSNNLRRLCGWESKGDIPSESTFSRAFEEFSLGGLGQKIHETMVKQHAGPKLAGHVSRDATAIDAREKPFRKEPKDPQSKPKRKRGRPRQGEAKPIKEPKRLDLQIGRNLAENMADLPTRCDVGTKLNAKGYKTSWTGYKFHIDSIDGDIPVSAILSSASMHDSQAAIPLAQMTAGRIYQSLRLDGRSLRCTADQELQRWPGACPDHRYQPQAGGEERNGSCASGAFQESQHSRAGQLEFEGQLWWPVRAGARSSQGDDASDVRTDSDNGNAALSTLGMRER